MASKDVKIATKLGDWDEVDKYIKTLGETIIQIKHLEGEATKKINAIKESTKNDAKGLQESKKYLDGLIVEFCERNKAQFSKKRHKKLNFGTVAYRLVQSVPIPRDKLKLSSLLGSLKAFNLFDCIKQEEKPDREKIIGLDDTTIVKLGLKKTISDKFRIEPEMQKIQETLQ